MREVSLRGLMLSWTGCSSHDQKSLHAFNSTGLSMLHLDTLEMKLLAPIRMS